jgi:hypothetical protein
MSEEKMSLEELQEQVSLTLYDILSNPEKYAKEWKMFGITKEQADKDIAIYHEKYGIPDMSKLKERPCL